MKKNPKKGFALVLVLSVVALLTITVLAFYSNSIMQTQMSRSSGNIIKADEFATGAFNSVISALKEEISAGSTVEHGISYPTSIINAVPALAGSTGANGLQSLLKVSSSTAPFRAGGSVIASSISSASINSSLDGRHVPAARWNAPLLMPPTSTSDLTPNSSDFVAPEWIYVSRNGANPTTWNNSLRWSSSDNSTVIGRYAFAVYNVGGLLDANVAGYPSQVTNSVATERRIAHKSASAYADLTRIGLTQNKTDQLVNWRNAATFSNNATKYLNSVESNTNGFLTTANTNLVANQSDRQFTNRQQLIDFVRNKLSGNADLATLKSLQYLTPFSRSLEQPSFRPDPDRPKVQSRNVMPPAVYTGGNDAYELDEQINPPLLKVRVTTPLIRRDGTSAEIGEPLVKKRFPLECLSWITCRGPSASRNFSDPDMVSLLSNPGVTEDLLRRGTPENIRNYIGLVWDSSNNLWNYAPGAYGSSLASSPTRTTIENLENISGRDPNFIELLKAAIHVGSLGKVPSGVRTPPSGYSINEPRVRNPFIKFTTTDYHIIQIAANIIGQVKADGYPLRIRFHRSGITPDPGAMLFSSSQNLPYIYRWRYISVFTHLSDPLPPPLGTPISAWPTGPLLDEGQGILLLIPEIWNPYDPNTVIPAMRPGPGELRVVLDNNIVNSITPAQAVTGLGGLPLMTAYNQYGGTRSNLVDSSDQVASTPDNSALVFGDNNAMLFFEPTALRNPGIPAGSGLTTGPAHRFRQEDFMEDVVDVNGGVQDILFQNIVPNHSSVIGMLIGSFPLVTLRTDGKIADCTHATLPSGRWNQAVLQNYNFITRTAMTFRMQCRDVFGNWIDYDTKEYNSGMDIGTGSADVGASAGNGFMPFASNHGGFYASSPNSRLAGQNAHYYLNDPRTRRFGVNVNYIDSAAGVNPPNLDPSGNSVYSTADPEFPAKLNAQNVLGTTRPRFNLFNSGEGGSVAFRLEKAWYRTNTGFVFSGSGQRLGEHSERLTAQNNPESRDDGVTAYYSDADGVVRRAMGAYTPLAGSSTSSDDGLPTTTATSGWNTGALSPTAQSQSRPTILHRPFRSVAELGYVFRDIPWKNLDFFTPESGDSALLDVFCIRESEGDMPIVAGKVDLNTKQPKVLEALLAGGLIDEHLKSGTVAVPLNNASISADATKIAAALVNRTSNSPLTNIAELVGRYDAASAGYDGFSEDLTGLFSQPAHNVIQRFREAPIRVLSNTGQTRVWNLLIDVVAQTGKFPVSATGLEQFVVEAESRQWVHIAIDRLTGEVFDMQVETVSE